MARLGKIEKVPLSVISFNTYGAPVLSKKIKERYTRLATILNGSSADILSLQEVHTYRHLKILKKMLKQYPYVVYKKYLYGPRGGLVTFSKMPIESCEYSNFQKRGSLTNKSFVAKLMRNGVLLAKLSGYPIYVLNTHLTPNTDLDWSLENRISPFTYSQLMHVAEVTDALVSMKNEVIITGDFNTPKDSELYEAFMNTSELQDVFSEYDTSTKIPELSQDGRDLERIDYIFLTQKNAKADVFNKEHIFEKKQEVDGEMAYLSDHIGLKTEFVYYLNRKRVAN
jgi:endonuclease/exonuclease/phosphatase family metal-dependent hydrolase